MSAKAMRGGRGCRSARGKTRRSLEDRGLPGLALTDQRRLGHRIDMSVRTVVHQAGTGRPRVQRNACTIRRPSQATQGTAIELPIAL